jgi:hypothetical protein
MTTDQINAIIPGLDLTETHHGKEVKGWTRDEEGGGTTKFYLDSRDCRRLAALFQALAEELA